MTIAVMLEQSGVLTLLGMGIVFGFLVIMIICITLLGKVIHALGWDKDVQQAAVTAAPAAPVISSSGTDAVITAVIAAAVTEYRKTNS
ncbi:MAG: OadG family protein [Treponema sp.]|jgi:oxaloacetate decarboxylase gamma subunit|nr:OadG family protein [Treponema sp.]